MGMVDLANGGWLEARKLPALSWRRRGALLYNENHSLGEWFKRSLVAMM